MAKIFRRYESTIYGNYRKAYLIDGALTGAVMSMVMLLRDWLATSPMSSPENYVTELVPGIIDEEQETGETFNARDYLVGHRSEE